MNFSAEEVAILRPYFPNWRKLPDRDSLKAAIARAQDAAERSGVSLAQPTRADGILAAFPKLSDGAAAEIETLMEEADREIRMGQRVRLVGPAMAESQYALERIARIMEDEGIDHVTGEVAPGASYPHSPRLTATYSYAPSMLEEDYEVDVMIGAYDPWFEFVTVDDPYVPTIGYDHAEGAWLIGVSWGDWLDTQEERGTLRRREE